MTSWKHYLLPHTLTDALRAMDAADGRARPIAGGTDLLLDLQQGRHPPIDVLVDISQVAEMNILELRSESAFIGAAVPLSRLVAAPMLRTHAQALIEACGLIGGPQVRQSRAGLGEPVPYEIHLYLGKARQTLPRLQGEFFKALAQVEQRSAGGRDGDSRVLPFPERDK